MARNNRPNKRSSGQRAGNTARGILRNLSQNGYTLPVQIRLTNTRSRAIGMFLATGRQFGQLQSDVMHGWNLADRLPLHSPFRRRLTHGSLLLAPPGNIRYALRLLRLLSRPTIPVLPPPPGWRGPLLQLDAPASPLPSAPSRRLAIQPATPRLVGPAPAQQDPLPPAPGQPAVVLPAPDQASPPPSPSPGLIQDGPPASPTPDPNHPSEHDFFDLTGGGVDPDASDPDDGGDSGDDADDDPWNLEGHRWLSHEPGDLYVDAYSYGSRRYNIVHMITPLSPPRQ